MVGAMDEHSLLGVGKTSLSGTFPKWYELGKWRGHIWGRNMEDKNVPGVLPSPAERTCPLLRE